MVKGFRAEDDETHDKAVVIGAVLCSIASKSHECSQKKNNKAIKLKKKRSEIETKED